MTGLQQLFGDAVLPLHGVTKQQFDSGLALKANVAHTHSTAEIIGLDAQLSLIIGATVSTKSSSYTVLSSDRGTTLNLIGAAYYAITFGAVGGYAVGSYAIINNDTRAKKIILTGGITYKLWPGQSDIISNVSGAWKALKGPTRYLMTAGTVINIDQANGVADTDGWGSGAGAFNSFRNAYQSVIDNFDTAGKFVAFYFAAGQNYTGNDILFDYPLTGNGQIIIDGQGSTLWQTAAGTSFSANLNYAGPVGNVTIRNAELLNSVGPTATISYPGEINFSTGIVFSNAIGPHLQASGSGCIIYLNNNYSIKGGGTQHYQAAQGGFIVDYAPTITFTTNVTFSQFALADRNSVLQMNANAFALGGFTCTAQRYIVVTGANIAGTGGSVTYFPGTSAGFTGSGYYS
jgi:hypothetical protein